MRIGISYWSKGEHEELAVHEFNEAGAILRVAQFERNGAKSATTGDNELLAEAFKSLTALESRCPQPEPIASSR
jgi:hypothetical protein